MRTLVRLLSSWENGVVIGGAGGILRSFETSFALGLLALAGSVGMAQKRLPLPEPTCSARVYPAYTASSLAPGGETVYSLPQLIALAELHNPDAKAAWESVQSAAALVGIARSQLLPTLAFSAFALRGNVLIGSDSNVSGGGYIKINATIFEAALAATYSGDFGTNLNSFRSTKHLLASEKAALNDTNQKVALDVSKKYYDYISNKASTAMSAADEDDSCLNLKESELELRNGLGSFLSVKSARAKYLKAHASTLQARGKQADTKIGLAGLIGLPPEQSFEVAPLAEAPPVTVVTENVEALRNHALANSPQIAKSDEQIEAAHYSVKSTRRKYFPTYSIEAQQSYTNSTTAMDPGAAAAAAASSTNTKGPTYLFLGSLKWNLFDGGMVRNEVKAAAASERQLRDKAVKTRLNLQQDVTKSYNDILYDLANEDAAIEALSAAKDSLDAATIAKSNGLASALDVSKAELAYASAQSSHVQARATLLEDATQLAYDTGDLLSTGAESPAQVEVKHVP